MRKVFPAEKKHPMSFAIFKEIPVEFIRQPAGWPFASKFPYAVSRQRTGLTCLSITGQSIRKSSLPASRLVRACSKRLSEIPTDRGFAGDNSGLKFLCRRIFAEVTFKADYYNNEGLPRPLAPFDSAFKFVASKLKLAGLHKFLHYNDWFRNALSDVLAKRADRPRTSAPKPFLEPRKILWNPWPAQHIAGRKNYALEINAVLTLEAIERLLFRELPRDN